MQDVIDWVQWFAALRDESVGVGITKIRQITFQQVARAAGVAEGEDMGVDQQEELVDSSVIRSHRCAGCMCCTLLISIEQLSKDKQTEILDVLQKHGLDIPPRQTGKFTAAFCGPRRKRKMYEVDYSSTDWEYLMTYKTSM
jgi:hypothetical protein